ncbi:MAG: tRNA (adenosine(37)-N6)-threonylcarbamoyltransferase complex dimerization subunit type 1 TsaB [Chlamydiales bacterium]|nr:tRNA (adenosine(37)-N6)-threonylcarbamoyltransferase complex dimerization subunit type 1 TsaB [Chlamydiales bacterium]
MRSIIIDTSTEKPLILYAEGHEVVIKKTLPIGYQSSKHLINMLGVDFEIVGVTQGPGLLTGVRVGMAAAQGLSIGLEVPLVGLCSFRGFLREGVDAAVIDAKVHGAYVMKRGGEGAFYTLEELPKALEGCSCIAGPNLRRVEFSNKIECEPDPYILLEQLIQKFQRREFGLTPNYLI